MPDEEFRYTLEAHRYTKWQRIRIWFNGVVEAIKTVPSKSYSEWILLHPGDTRYETAPWRSIMHSNPLRYKYENGEWIQVNPSEESTEINLSCRDA